MVIFGFVDIVCFVEKLQGNTFGGAILQCRIYLHLVSGMQNNCVKYRLPGAKLCHAQATRHKTSHVQPAKHKKLSCTSCQV